jgi:serine/threonine protein kinase
MIGRTVAQYRFIDKLGAGGMGEIYKAQDTRLNRFVAIKVLTASKSGTPERRKRFLQEAQAASSLNHPNIITIHDVLSEGDTDFMVMEFVAGKTLSDLIPKGGLRVPQTLKYALQMADALQTAHAAGIIHRDLKPGNIMVTDSGLVKILDFGLAKFADRNPVTKIGEDDETLPASEPLTVEGSIMGTVAYMSPEQAQGKKVDARSDIFSFGAVLYEMVTGRRAFEGDSTLSTLSSILRDDAKPMSEVAPDVPAQLEEVIRQCLRKPLDDRYQSMREVQGALALLKRESDSGSLYATRTLTMAAAAGAASGLTHPAASPSRPKSAAGMTAPRVSPDSGLARMPDKTILAIATVVVLLIGGGGTYWWFQKRAAETAGAESARMAAQAAAEAAAQAAQAQAEMQRAIEAAAKEAEKETLNNDSVLELVASKVPVQLILEHIRSAMETKFDLSTSGLIRLTKAGTPAVVIEQMRNPKRVPPRIEAAVTKAPANTSASAPAAGVKPLLPAPAPVPVPIATGDSHNLAVAATPAPTIVTSPAAPQTVQVTVADALPIKMSLADDIRLDADVGHALRFTVSEDFVVQGAVVIPKGATIFGEISETPKKRRFLGIGNGKLSFTLSKAEAASGQEIKVRAMAARRSDGPTQRTVDTGKSGTRDFAAVRGTEYLAYVDGPQTVSVPK